MLKNVLLDWGYDYAVYRLWLFLTSSGVSVRDTYPQAIGQAGHLLL